METTKSSTRWAENSPFTPGWWLARRKVIIVFQTSEAVFLLLSLYSSLTFYLSSFFLHSFFSFQLFQIFPRGGGDFQNKKPWYHFKGHAFAVVRNVLVLSTMEQIRGRAFDDKDKPAVIYFYNMTMGNVFFFLLYFLNSQGCVVLCSYRRTRSILSWRIRL